MNKEKIEKYKIRNYYMIPVEIVDNIFYSFEQENQQLRIQISAREEVCNRLESNRNQLKEIIKKKIIVQGGFTSYEWNDLLNELLDKMQELEQGDLIEK